MVVNAALSKINDALADVVEELQTLPTEEQLLAHFPHSEGCRRDVTKDTPREEPVWGWGAHLDEPIIHWNFTRGHVERNVFTGSQWVDLNIEVPTLTCKCCGVTAQHQPDFNN